MKWYLIIQMMLGNQYYTIADFPTEQACKTEEQRAVSKHIIGLMAKVPTMTWCMSQGADENRFPKSRTDGKYVCKYPVGKCTKVSQ